MRKYYVVGNKTSKSLSPLIFNYWFKKYKIKAKYNYLELNNQNFDSQIKKTIKNEKVRGLNITIPFKQKIFKHIDVLDHSARKISAVNCVKIDKNIYGTNTDWEGYYKTLPKNHNLKSKKVLILGYGGAALAIHYVLKKKQFKDVVILNRTKKKLKFKRNTEFTKNISSLDKHLPNAALIINTTPKNLITKKNKHLINKKTILSDIVYNPKETDFLKSFPNNKKIYGVSMLLEQAIPCFKLWFGFKPSIDNKLLNILNKKIK